MNNVEKLAVDKREPYRLAVLTSHPIQYQAPLFRALAARPELDLHVYFCSRWGAEPYQDPGFQIRLSWDTPLLQGYRYTFLRNLSFCPRSAGFLRTVNPGIGASILQSKFDALLIHGWALTTNWLAWAIAAARCVPLLLRGETNGLAEPAGVKRTAKRIALKAFFSQVAGFLAIGTNNANFYKSYGVREERIFWTPYAVDNDFFMERGRRLAGQKRFLHEKEGILPDLPVILFCGKLIEQKRPFDLLKAFASLEGYLKASLIFVGDGPLRAEMEHFIADHRLANVHFLGFRNQTELAACYAMADVLVLPSSFEPWGLVLNEAMCFGLPVITSDQVGAAADLVRHGANGFIYPVGDVQTLASCLRRMVEDDQACRVMGQNSLTIISKWGLEESVQGVLRCLESVVCNPKNSALRHKSGAIF